MENLENEIWKDIEGYEGLYQVSNMGRVKSFHRNKENILNRKPKRDGYCEIRLSKNKTDKSYKIHRLVAQAFCYNDDPINKTVVNHINENKSDNRAINLEWVTQKQNVLHSSYKTSNSLKGNTNRGEVIRCVELDKIFNSITEASEEFNCSISAISKCLNGKNKTSCGLHWERVNNTEEPLQLDNEIWKLIEDYPNYEISNFGRVKSLNYSKSSKPKILKQSLDSHGYPIVGLYNDKKRKTMSVHILVCNAFCNGYKDGYIINHIDEDKTNNKASNLEWVSVKQNTIHSAYKYTGINGGTSRATICLTTTRLFGSLKEAGDYYNLSKGNITYCCQGKTSYAGKLLDGTPLVWKYLNYKHNIILRGKDISKLHKNDKRLE